MKQGWKYKDFEDCLEKVVYTTKILSKDYLSDGEYPIVSQEEGLISGYWNKREDLFQLKKPVVLFGDHTRVLKYVDFDFVIGADGVKILQPIEQLFAKFLYYFLQWYKVPSLGYSRHYKLLKEITVPIPPIEEQKEICSLLDKLNWVIEARKEQLKELDNLIQSLFYDMFGDPAVNEKGWDVVKLGEICTFSQGIQVGVEEQSIEPKQGWNRFLRIVDYTTDNTDIRYVNVNDDRYRINKDDIAMVKYGSVGVANIGKEGILANNLFKISYPNTVLDKLFLLYSFRTDYFWSYIKKSAFGATMPALSFRVMNDYRVMLPPLPLQQAFAEKVKVIEQQKELINQSIKDVQTLFDAKMDYYFGD